MGQLIHKKGDFLTSTALIVGHGCNCRGGYGSGVAGVIARLYPQARIAYIKKFKEEGWTPGEVQFVEVHPKRMIANMATQDTYGGAGDHVKYEAIEECFRTVLETAECAGCSVAIPKIGSGLAGGDWARIETIIRDELRYYQVNVECYTL
jgi:O-acetyl-ADP-ribose deacetylase (regulator of RNase III)